MLQSEHDTIVKIIKPVKVPCKCKREKIQSAKVAYRENEGVVRAVVTPQEENDGKRR